MKFLSILSLILFLVSYNNEVNAQEQCEFLKHLSPYQVGVAYQAYRFGEEHDLQLTMVAIAWKESNLGLYKIRLGKDTSDMSYGVMHTVAKWKTKDKTSFERGMWAQKMVESDEYSLGVGLEDLLYWQERSDGDWLETVGRYNGGNVPNTQYAKDISSLVSALKHCDF